MNEDDTVTDLLKVGEEYLRKQVRLGERIPQMASTSTHSRGPVPVFNLDDSTVVSSKAASTVPHSNSRSSSISQSIAMKNSSSKRPNSSQLTDIGLSVSNLKRRLTEKEAELHYAKALNDQLQCNLSQKDPETKIKLIELEKELDIMKNKLSHEKSRNLSLSEKLKKFENQDSQQRGMFDEREDELEMEIKKLKSRLQIATKKVTALEGELQEEKCAKISISKAFESEMIQLQSDLSIMEDHLKTQKEQFKLLTRTMQDSFEMEKNLLTSKYEQEIASLQQKLRDQEDSEIFVNSMKSNIKQLMEREKEVPILKEQIKKLRENQDNVMLLNEKVKTLKNQLRKEQQTKDEITKLAVENQSLKSSLYQWEALAKSQGEECSPTVVSSRLAVLQQSQLTLKEELGALNTELKVAKAHQQRAENESKSLRLELEQVKKTMENVNQFARKLRNRQLLLVKECESYKRIISSYESEVTVDLGQLNKERITNLEALVEEYKNLVNLNEPAGPPAASKLSEELNSKQSEIERLNSLVISLQANISRNNENPSGPGNESDYRVLHFRANPVTFAEERRQKEIAALKQENEKLKMRIHLLIEKGADASSLAAENTCEIANSEQLTALREQLQSAEHKNKRMMEAFKRSSSEFRETCYLLTGYKIDLIAPKKYKLTHVFADAPGDHLLFESTDDGKLLLLETDFSKSILPLIEDLLGRQNCIPAFLSTLTLNLYSKQTVMFASFSN